MCYLVILRCSGVQRPAQKQLSDDTTQGPHVYGLTEGQTQDDLWSSANTQKWRINFKNKVTAE